VAPLVAALLLLGTFDVQSLDVWFHLRTGDYILATGIWPRNDPFSYTATHLWVAHEWLSGVLYALVYKAFGVPGLVVLNASLLAACLMLVFLACDANGCGPAPSALLVFLAFLGIRSDDRCFIRPDEFLLLFVAAVLLIVAVSRRRGPRVLLLLPVIQLAWANLHGGGSVLGVAMAFLVVIGEAMRRSADEGRRLRVAAQAFALTTAAWFVNPYGWRVPVYFLHAFGHQTAGILEWRNTRPSDLLGIFGTILALALAGCALERRRLHPGDLLLSAFLTLLGLRYVRLIPVALIATVPLAALALTAAASRVRERLRLPGPGAASGLLILVAAAYVVHADTHTFGSPYRFGFGVDEQFLPVGAVEFVRAHELRGPMFNSFGFGGYLMWARPQEKVFIDGRADAYGEDFIARYRAFPRKEIWDGLVRQYGFTYAVLDNEPTYVCETLDDDRNWVLVYWDDRALVYVRAIPAHADVVRRFAFHSLKPNNRDFSYMGRYLAAASDREAVLRELGRSVAESPSNVNAHLMRAWFCSRIGGAASLQALEDYDAVLALLPRRGDLWRQKGIALLALERWPEARRALETAVRLAPDDFEAHHRLSAACYMLGDVDAAVRECRAALALDPGSVSARRNLETFMRPRQK
jgi:hypothetical protein